MLTKIYFSKPNKKVNKRKYQEWFDDDCMKLKQEVNTKRKKISRSLKKTITPKRNEYMQRKFLQIVKQF